MKKLLLLMMIILILPFVYSTNITTFTNGLSTENITYTDANIYSRYVQVPTNSNITDANINFKSYAYNGMCYQGYANESTLCGGLDTGKYYIYPNMIDVQKGFDNNYSTYSYRLFSTFVGNTLNNYINYTIPENITGLPVWDIKYGYDNYGPEPYVVISKQVNIIDACINETRDTVNLGIDLASNIPINSNITYYCFDIDNNKIILESYDYSFISTGVLYEESIIWKKNITVTNLNVTIGDNSNYTSGKFDTLNLSITNYLTTLLPECTCIGCNEIDDYCTIPITFKSDTAGILNIDSLLVDYQINNTMYLVDEQTGDLFDVANITSVIVYDDEDNFLYSLSDAGINEYNFLSEPTGKRRIELKYPDGSIINRYIDVSVTGTNFSVCANYENVTHYEQLITSARERKVKMISQFADCYVAADYTRFAYQDSYILKAYTTDRPYTVRAIIDEVETDLAGFDGGISSYINLDTLEFSKTAYDFNILSDSISFSKKDGVNQTIIIRYLNLREDNSVVEITIYNMDDDSIVYNQNTYSNPNEVVIAFDYSLLNVNDTTLFKIVVDKIDDAGLESSITRFFNTNLKTGILNSLFAFVLGIILLFFGLTFTTIRITLGWFGIIIDLMVLALLSFAYPEWYITFLTGLTVVFMLYKAILMSNKNISTVA